MLQFLVRAGAVTVHGNGKALHAQFRHRVGLEATVRDRNAGIGATVNRGLIDWNATNLRAADLLAQVGLTESPVTKITDIGVGKQQLVEIAKALSKDVKLLILDEPTAALNEGDSQHLLDLIAGLRSKGVTCIMISPGAMYCM